MKTFSILFTTLVINDKVKKVRVGILVIFYNKLEMEKVWYGMLG